MWPLPFSLRLSSRPLLLVKSVNQQVAVSLQSSFFLPRSCAQVWADPEKASGLWLLGGSGSERELQGSALLSSCLHSPPLHLPAHAPGAPRAQVKAQPSPGSPGVALLCCLKLFCLRSGLYNVYLLTYFCFLAAPCSI